MYDEYLTIDEFAKHMKVHHNTVRRAIKNGKIQSVNIGSGKKCLHRIPKSELQRLGLFQLDVYLKNLKKEV